MSEPIRVLQVVTIMDLGGVENFLMNLYRNIDRSKIQFDFLMHREKEGIFDKEILELGGRIYRFKAIRPWRYIQYIEGLKTFFRNHSEYLIIHSHINANSNFILKVAKQKGVPIRIAHSHTAASVKSYKFLVNMLAKIVPKVATHRLACSQEAGDWLFGDNDFQIFNNAIDTLKFQFNESVRQKLRHSLDIKNSDIVFGNIANFNPVKNHEFLLKVFGRYHYINPKSKLILIGEGELRQDIEKQIKQLGLVDSVILTGAIQNPQDYLSTMDIYLFTSLFEGLGISLIEAQCNGLPILMSDCLPQDAIVTDLIHQKSLLSSEEEWTEEISNVLESHKNNDRLVYREQVLVKGFDVVSNMKQIEDLYLNALSEITK